MGSYSAAHEGETGMQLYVKLLNPCSVMIFETRAVVSFPNGNRSPYPLGVGAVT